MKRLAILAVCGVVLALCCGAWAEAQQPPARRQPVRKARRVWTNDDFPERPAPKAEAPAAKAEAAGTKPAAAAATPEGEAKPAAKASAAGDGKPAESLDDLELAETNAVLKIGELQEQSRRLIEEKRALEEKRDNAVSSEDLFALKAQIEEKSKELAPISSQLFDTQSKLQEIRDKKAALQPPPPAEKPGPAPGEKP